MATCTPNWTSFLAGAWGPSSDSGLGLPFAIISQASNVVCGTNPPYTIQDFYANYPADGGTPALIPNVVCEIGNPVVTTAATLPAGLAVGNPVAGTGIPNGTFITNISGQNITLSAPPTTGLTITLTVWNAPTIPSFITQLYINLASASLVQARWQEQWVVAMGWFVQHYLILYARSSGNPNSTIGMIAASGLAFGIQTSKSVGDVSVGYQAILTAGLEQFGAWNLTLPGQLLATAAQAVGAGPMLLY